MTAVNVSARPKSNLAPARRPSVPLSVKGGIAGLVVGYVIAMAIVYLFRLWATQRFHGAHNVHWFQFKQLVGLYGPGGYTWAGYAGGLLGFLGGLVGVRRAYGQPGFLRALLGAGIGYPIGAVIPMLVRLAFDMHPYNAGVVVVSGIVTSFLVYTWGIGGWGGTGGWWDYMLGRPTPEHEDHSGHGAVNGWKSYFTFNTDHKVIGTQYLVLTFFFFLIAGGLAELVRSELANPGLQYLADGVKYNSTFSLHGILMLLLFIIPVFAGLANYILPLMIGAADMAFPKLNALSFWTLAFGGVVFLASIPVGAFDAGWTNYAPLSSTGGTVEAPLGQIFFILGVQLAGTSSIMTAINFLVTIIGMRAPGMTMWRMPLLVWANFTTSLLVVFGTPFIAGSQFMVLFDRLMHTNFFNIGAGGDPISYQHIFWFYSHPAVYIMMLPGFGIISEVITTHARKPIFGYRALAISTIAIGFLGFTVWAHHMFSSGMADWLRLPMMLTTMLIAVPTGVKVLGWAATLWGGKIHFTTAMKFAIGFLFTFTVGGVTGIMLASVPFDLHVTDSYFVVAHFHYVLVGGSVMTVFAGVYHWFPKMTGRMYDEKLGNLHFWMFFIALNLTFFPMHWVGTLGMPRRYADYGFLPGQGTLHTWNFIISVAAFLQGVSFAIFVYNMVNSSRRGPIVGGNPWRSRTLEWLVSSPPPLYNFYDTPVVVGAPYDFGHEGTRHAVVAEKGQSTLAELERLGLTTAGSGTASGATAGAGAGKAGH